MRRLAILFLLILTACGAQVNAPVAPGQSGNYQVGVGINQRLEVYQIRGTVLGAGESIQRFEQSGRASFYNGTGSAYIQSTTPGKGFIRFQVETITWTNELTSATEIEPLAVAGDTVLLKTSDSKAASLMAGDRATFLCREQAEFVEAVAGNERPMLEKITREFDYCRMLTPVIEVAKQP